jgi:hypothetical protein
MSFGHGNHFTAEKRPRKVKTSIISVKIVIDNKIEQRQKREEGRKGP